MSDIKTVTIRNRFDEMRSDASFGRECAGNGLPPMLADIKRDATEAQIRYEIARIDAYETFCRTLAPALIEAYRKVYGEGMYVSTHGTPEDRALREIATRFPFDKFMPEYVLG